MGRGRHPERMSTHSCATNHQRQGNGTLHGGTPPGGLARWCQRPSITRPSCDPLGGAATMARASTTNDRGIYLSPSWGMDTGKAPVHGTGFLPGSGGSDSDQPGAGGKRGSLAAGIDPELVEDRAHMPLHRAWGDEEPLGDLRVGPALDEERE